MTQEEILKALFDLRKSAQQDLVNQTIHENETTDLLKSIESIDKAIISAIQSLNIQSR